MSQVQIQRAEGTASLLLFLAAVVLVLGTVGSAITAFGSEGGGGPEFLLLMIGVVVGCALLMFCARVLDLLRLGFFGDEASLSTKSDGTNNAPRSDGQSSTSPNGSLGNPEPEMYEGKVANYICPRCGVAVFLDESTSTFAQRVQARWECPSCKKTADRVAWRHSRAK